MLKKPAFWIVFVVLAVAAAIFASLSFSRAFPIVSVPIEMTREQALASARELAVQHGWGPAEPRLAASFDEDGTTQVFVELEAGGADRWRELIEGDDYQPYSWHVRLFKPGETTETNVGFTPRGAAYQFRERLPEDEPGAALGVEQARAIAERGAGEWGVDLAAFDRVEESQDTRPSGRVDHELVYRRKGVELGEGEVRLTLGVSGDRFTRLSHWVKVPEAFSRRYAEMRSANDGIAMVAGIVALVGYLLVIGGITFFVFLRRRWLLWKPAFAWGFAVGLLQGLQVLNQWPLAWMGYDTAVDPGAWTLQMVAAAVGVTVGMGLLLGFSFLIAEALTRRAFPRHVQLWRAWSPKAAASRPLWGQTLAGYLLVGVFFAYEVVLYFVTTQGLGWWSPTSQLADPNVLATWLPWLPPIATSAQAGMWEECLFRAVPIAAAALIGERLGKRRLFIIGAVILQALVFGGGHANYPAQPAYARLVELIVPSLIFAGLYLAFGLVPAIVMHYVYDVVWIALPVFTTDAEGTGLDKVLVGVLALIPVWMLVAGRLRAGRSSADVPDELRNEAWTPPPAEERVAEVAPERPPLTPLVSRALVALGVLALAAWAVVGPRPLESRRLEPTRDEALAAARSAFESADVPLGSPWQVVASVRSGIGDGHRHAWREGGPAALHALARFLGQPHWTVRVVRFEGDVATERAESWQVRVRGDGTTAMVTHDLPQAREGADLPREEALALAEQAVRDRYQTEPSSLELVLAEPTKQPARTDWAFSWKDDRDWPLPAGEGRLSIWIAGDEVVDSSRWLKVPEEWQRAERDRQARMQVVQLAGGGVVGLLLLVAIVGCVVQWARGVFSLRTALVFFALIVAVAAAQAVLSWPTVVAGFSTSQPLSIQIGTWALQQAIAVLLPAGLVALFAGCAQAWAWRARPGTGVGSAERILTALLAGAGVAAATTLLRRLLPAHSPPWSSLVRADAWLPAVADALDGVQGWANMAAIALLLLAALDRLTRAWTRRRGPATAFVVLLGFALAGVAGPFDVTEWLATGLVLAVGLLLLLIVVIRRDPTLVPGLAAGSVAVGMAGAVRADAWFAAIPGGLAGAVLVLVLGAWWQRRLAAPRQPQGTAPDGSRALGVAPAGEPGSSDTSGESTPPLD